MGESLKTAGVGCVALVVYTAFMLTALGLVVGSIGAVVYGVSWAWHAGAR